MALHPINLWQITGNWSKQPEKNVVLFSHLDLHGCVCDGRCGERDVFVIFLLLASSDAHSSPAFLSLCYWEPITCMYLLAARQSYFSLHLQPKTRFPEYGSLLLIGQFEERNAELEWAAVSGEDRCLTTLITAAKETIIRAYVKKFISLFHTLQCASFNLGPGIRRC